MLSAVSEKALELLPLIHSAYSSPSYLFIGDSYHPVARDSSTR